MKPVITTEGLTRRFGQSVAVDQLLLGLLLWAVDGLLLWFGSCSFHREQLIVRL